MRAKRLREDLETLVNGLERMRAELARVGEELEWLRRPGSDAARERQQDLTRITQSLRARWRDLDALAASLAQTAHGLRAYADDAERGGVDALAGPSVDRAVDQRPLQPRQSDVAVRPAARERRDEGRDRRDAALQRRLEEMESTLRRLSDGQESLELQTALLSREAEQDRRPSDVRPSSPDHRAVEERQALRDEIALLKKAGGTLHERLIEMASRGHTLEETVHGLGLRQARQDNETRGLDKRLRTRSVIGLTALALIAAFLVFVSLRLPTPIESERLAALAAKGALVPERPTVAELAQKIAELRAETADAIDALADADRQQQKARAEIAAEQARLRGALDRIQAEKKTLSEGAERSATRAVETPAPSSPARQTTEPSLPAGEPASAPANVPAPSTSPAKPAAGVSGPGERWGRARVQGLYTLQLVGVHERRHLTWFLERHRVDGENAVYHRKRDGRPWLELFHGIYRTPAQALAASRDLPADLAAQRPWVRQIPPTGRLEPL